MADDTEKRLKEILNRPSRTEAENQNLRTEFENIRTGFGELKALYLQNSDRGVKENILTEIVKKSVHFGVVLNQIVSDLSQHRAESNAQNGLINSMQRQIQSLTDDVSELSNERGAYSQAKIFEKINSLESKLEDSTGMIFSYMENCTRLMKEEIQKSQEERNRYSGLMKNLENLASNHEVTSYPALASRDHRNIAEEHYTRGKDLLGRNRLDDAIRECEKAIEIDSEYAPPYVVIGNCRRDKGDISGAINEYKKAIRLDSNYFRAHHNLGICYFKKGNLNSAISEFRDAIRINPNNEDPHFCLGICYKEQGEFMAAIQELRNTIHLNPNHAVAHCSLGFCYAVIGDIYKSNIELQKGLLLDPNLRDQLQ